MARTCLHDLHSAVEACVFVCVRAVLREKQHLAATGPNIEILRRFLLQGASVHLRNHTGSGRTPLFLAANGGLTPHVMLLRRSGAHLHSAEWQMAKLHYQHNRTIWQLAGVDADTEALAPNTT